jgi:hypothetical protein
VTTLPITRIVNTANRKLSAINHSVSAVFVHLYDGGFCWVLKGKFKGAVFDIVIGFSLAYNFDAQTKPWLSINSGDPQITEDLSVRHLAETQPYNDEKLQAWEDLRPPF